MNSNLFHNIANILMIVVAGASAVLTQLGCTTMPGGELECTQVTFLTPTMAATIVAALGVAKMLVNIVRDGFSGLSKQQPPVK